MKTTQTVWLTDPSQALNLNFEDGDDFFEKTYLSPEKLDMSTHGWKKLGTANCHYSITVTSHELSREAVQQAEKKLAEMDADHEVKRNLILGLIGKLQSLEWNGRTE
jgi:hypothetical protein